KLIKRKQMNEHILNDCPETVIDCLFIGCEKRIKRNQIANHCQQDWQYHLQQNNVTIKNLSKQFETFKESVTKSIEQNNETTLNLSKQLQQLSLQLKLLTESQVNPYQILEKLSTQIDSIPFTRITSCLLTKGTKLDISQTKWKSMESFYLFTSL